MRLDEITKAVSIHGNRRGPKTVPWETWSLQGQWGAETSKGECMGVNSAAEEKPGLNGDVLEAKSRKCIIEGVKCIHSAYFSLNTYWVQSIMKNIQIDY